MNKDKLTDRRDNNNIENKKEDYKDSNGSPEDFIEDMTDPEATDLFKEAFYAEGKALEEEALRSPFVEDEEKKEALRLRILAIAGKREDEASGESAARETDSVELENADWENETVAAHRIELETEMTAGENVDLKAKAMAGENVRKKDKARSVAASGDDALGNKKRHKFMSMVRWAAVIILVCVGVFGVSMTSQAKGSELWSSIQRLIGGETRWEQENNGDDRSISDPEEYKAIGEIEEKLEIQVPEFFYWPGEMIFSGYEIFEGSGVFLMVYTYDEKTIYFEGDKGEGNVSANSVWQTDEEVKRIDNDNVSYSIMKVDNDELGSYYSVRWTSGKNRFYLYGVTNLDEMEKIVKNIKN